MQKKEKDVRNLWNVCIDFVLINKIYPRTKSFGYAMHHFRLF